MQRFVSSDSFCIFHYQRLLLLNLRIYHNITNHQDRAMPRAQKAHRYSSSITVNANQQTHFENIIPKITTIPHADLRKFF